MAPSLTTLAGAIWPVGPYSQIYSGDNITWNYALRKLQIHHPRMGYEGAVAFLEIPPDYSERIVADFNKFAKSHGGADLFATTAKPSTGGNVDDWKDYQMDEADQKKLFASVSDYFLPEEKQFIADKLLELWEAYLDANGPLEIPKWYHGPLTYPKINKPDYDITRSNFLDHMDKELPLTELAPTRKKFHYIRTKFHQMQQTTQDIFNFDVVFTSDHSFKENVWLQEMIRIQRAHLPAVRIEKAILGLKNYYGLWDRAFQYYQWIALNWGLSDDLHHRFIGRPIFEAVARNLYEYRDSGMLVNFNKLLHICHYLTSRLNRDITAEFDHLAHLDLYRRAEESYEWEDAVRMTQSWLNMGAMALTDLAELDMCKLLGKEHSGLRLEPVPNSLVFSHVVDVTPGRQQGQTILGLDNKDLSELFLAVTNNSIKLDILDAEATASNKSEAVPSTNTTDHSFSYKGKKFQVTYLKPEGLGARHKYRLTDENGEGELILCRTRRKDQRGFKPSRRSHLFAGEFENTNIHTAKRVFMHIAKPSDHLTAPVKRMNSVWEVIRPIQPAHIDWSNEDDIKEFIRVAVFSFIDALDKDLLLTRFRRNNIGFDPESKKLVFDLTKGHVHYRDVSLNVVGKDMVEREFFAKWMTGVEGIVVNKASGHILAKSGVLDFFRYCKTKLDVFDRISILNFVRGSKYFTS